MDKPRDESATPATPARSRRRVIPIVAAMAAALGLLVLPLIVAPSVSEAIPSGVRDYLGELRGRVETPAGAPRPGRDPATQRQQSLATAAAQPQGAGRRVVRPARSVRLNRARRVTSAQIYGALRARGLNETGCFFDYGAPGAHCLPAHVARGRTVTCTAVRAHFPNGIAVTGRDRFRLDRNGDAVACGPGD